MTKKKLFIVFIIMAMVLVLTGCGNSRKEESESKEEESNSYETAMQCYFEGIEKGDYKTYKKAFPSFYDSYENNKEYLTRFHDSFVDEYGDDFTIKYEIIDKEELDKKELEKVQEVIDDLYDEEVKVTNGYELEIKITVKGSEGKDKTNANFKVYEIDGSWYYMYIDEDYLDDEEDYDDDEAYLDDEEDYDGDEDYLDDEEDYADDEDFVHGYGVYDEDDVTITTFVGEGDDKQQT